MAASSFRATKWDPIYILSQIFALQSLSYILFSLLLSIALLLLGTADTSLDLIFDDAEIRTDTGFGWSLIILWIVHAFITILLLTFIVQRARQILDFVLTFHFLHFCLCCYLNSRWPSSIAWWLLQGVDIIIMTFGGEWACMKNEMKPILITGGTKRPTSHKMSDTTTLSTEPDIELGDMAASSSHSQRDQSKTALLEDDALSRSNSPAGRMKRKTSDAFGLTHHQQEEEEEEEEEGGPLMTAVGKAKEVLLTKKNSSSRKSKRKSRQPYDRLPMTDKEIDDTSSSTHASS